MLADVVMWFSSGGTKSVLHTDSYENINCLFSGSKRLWMAGPEHAHSINFDEPGGSFSKVIYHALLAYFLTFALFFFPFASVCHYRMGRNAVTHSYRRICNSIVFWRIIWWWIAYPPVWPILLIRTSTDCCWMGFTQGDSLTLPGFTRDPLVV